MNDAPNLYECHGLDRADSCNELGLLLAGRDAMQESRGYGATDPTRRELQLCFAIMSNQSKRKLYDQALAAGRPLTWEELEHLADFGSWPDPILKPQSQPQPKPQNFSQQPGPYAQDKPKDSPYAQPFNPYQIPNYSQRVPAQQQYKELDAQRVANRASAGNRIGMALLDMIFASMIGGTISAAIGVDTGMLAWLVIAIVSVVYVVGTESYFGASPAKKMFGYEVRDVDTGEKLTALNSAKRQWFKISHAAVPVVGQLAGVVGAIWGASTINPQRNLIAAHDELGNAEVVRRNHYR